MGAQAGVLIFFSVSPSLHFARNSKMSSTGQYAEIFSQIPTPPNDYPPMEERPYPERFTNDIVRDSLPDLDFQLEEACVKGDIDQVHELISNGANKNAPLDKEGKTALMIACQLGWFDLVKHLVEVEDVEIDAMSRAGLRAIDYAGKERFRWPNEDVEIADYLKTQGSQYTWWGAAFCGDYNRLQVFLENGQDINEINPVLWNYNALDCALHGGCASTVQWLIARGALIMVRNCHVAVWDEMLWSIGRGDSFMYKEWGIEEGPYFKI